MELRDVTEHGFNRWILSDSRNECGSGVRHGRENRPSKS